MIFTHKNSSFLHYKKFLAVTATYNISEPYLNKHGTFEYSFHALFKAENCSFCNPFELLKSDVSCLFLLRAFCLTLCFLLVFTTYTANAIAISNVTITTAPRINVREFTFGPLSLDSFIWNYIGLRVSNAILVLSPIYILHPVVAQRHEVWL